MNKIILLIDDDIGVLNVLKKLLQHELLLLGKDIIVESFLNALDAKKWILHKKNEDIVIGCICDVMMSECNGNEFHKWFKQHYQKIPFFFISGHSSYNITKDNIEEINTFFLQKPIDRFELMNILLIILNIEKSIC